MIFISIKRTQLSFRWGRNVFVDFEEKALDAGKGKQRFARTHLHRWIRKYVNTVTYLYLRRTYPRKLTPSQKPPRRVPSARFRRVALAETWNQKKKAKKGEQRRKGIKKGAISTRVSPGTCINKEATAEHSDPDGRKKRRLPSASRNATREGRKQKRQKTVTLRWISLAACAALIKDL